MNPVWVPPRSITIIHDRQISRHGGAAGLRDAGLLEIGCARPLNLATYGEADHAAAHALKHFCFNLLHILRS